MSKEEFVEKWRKQLGCKSPEAQVCWCEICCALEQIWEDVMKAAISILKSGADIDE